MVKRARVFGTFGSRALLMAGGLVAAACKQAPPDDGTFEIIERAQSSFGAITGAATILAPADAPVLDGRASICINTSWPDNCDAVLTGGVRAIRVPLAGSISVKHAGYIFDVGAINLLRTGGTEEGKGGEIKLTLTSVGPGCDVGIDSATLVAPIAKFWDTVTVSNVGKTMSWNMTGADAATFDQGDCLQAQNPASLNMSIQLPLVYYRGEATTELVTLSTVPGQGQLLPPLVLTNDTPPPPPLDFVFTIDTTGSMWDDLDAVKSSSIELVDTLFADVPTARIAVVDYKDVPQLPYGEPADYPFRVVADFSADRGQIVAAIQSLTASGGADQPESVYSALMGALQLQQDHLGHALSPWRSNAEKAILLLGDAPPHDPEPIRGYTLQIVQDAATAASVPLPDLPNITSTSPASGAGVAIYTLQVGNDSATRTFFEALSSGTGGQSFTAANANDLVSALREAIGVIVADPEPTNLPPETRWATPSQENLGLPNHQMVGLNILGVIDPEGAPVTLAITGITQDEPVSGPGRMSPDAAGVGTPSASLRAERNGSGNGRVYRITFIARDNLGAESTGAVRVCVPHDHGQNEVCHDDGQTYDSTAP